MRAQAIVFGVVVALWFLITPITAFLAVMSPELAKFGTGPGVLILKANFVTFPLACLLLPMAAWIAWGKGRHALAWAFAAAPLLWIVVPAVVWSILPTAGVSS